MTVFECGKETNFYNIFVKNYKYIIQYILIYNEYFGSR